MKKNYIVSILLILVLIAACKDKKATTVVAGNEGHNASQKYTCPMHPQIIKEAPGQCPICGMDLVAIQKNVSPGLDTSLIALIKPVDEQVVANIATIKAESGMRIFSEEVQGNITYDTRNQTSIASRVSGRIERLMIKYNYQAVKKGQLIMEIYAPDLVVAQRELLFIARNDKDGNMLQKAKLRLSLLGMSDGQIRQVLKTGNPIYKVGVYSNVSGFILEKPEADNRNSVSVASSNPSGMSEMDGGGSAAPMVSTATPSATINTPVLVREGQYVNAGQTIFTIYNENSFVAEFALRRELSAEVKPGLKLVYRLSSDAENVYTGTIGLIQPTIRSGQTFTLARVYIQNNNNLSVGSLVIANIPIIKKLGWWVPQKALLQLGNRSIIFRKNNDVFTPQEIETGYASKGSVQVLTDISDWEIAGNAAFLVDSESFIKAGKAIGKN